MNLKRIRTLFEFNYWANEQLLDEAAQLAEEQLYGPASVSHGKAFDLIRHMLDVEWSFRLFASGGDGQKFLWQVADVSDLAAVRRFWTAEAGRLFAFLDGLTDDDLDRPIDLGTAQGGAPRFMTIWQILMHVHIHSVQHRSELALYLEVCGRKLPGELGLGSFLVLQGQSG